MNKKNRFEQKLDIARRTVAKIEKKIPYFTPSKNQKLKRNKIVP